MSGFPPAAIVSRSTVVRCSPEASAWRSVAWWRSAGEVGAAAAGTLDSPDDRAHAAAVLDAVHAHLRPLQDAARDQPGGDVALELVRRETVGAYLPEEGEGHVAAAAPPHALRERRRPRHRR